jgi:hypothetical protein
MNNEATFTADKKEFGTVQKRELLLYRPDEISGQFVSSSYRCFDKKTCHVAWDSGCRLQYAKTRRLEHSSEQRRFYKNKGLHHVQHELAGFYDSNFV